MRELAKELRSILTDKYGFKPPDKRKWKSDAWLLMIYLICPDCKLPVIGFEEALKLAHESSNANEWLSKTEEYASGLLVFSECKHPRWMERPHWN